MDRGEAAEALDRAAAGNWRTLLERFAEDHAPAYLRRDAATSAALQSLASGGVELGVFTDAPEELARVALAQLGAARRVSRLESGAGALERILAALGPDAAVVRTRERPPAASVESRLWSSATSETASSTHCSSGSIGSPTSSSA